MPSIEFTIANQKFLVKSDENDDHLREVSELVRRKVETIRKKSPNISLQKATMLAAFDFASSTIKGKKRSLEAKKNLLLRAETLMEKVSGALDDNQSFG